MIGRLYRIEGGGKFYIGSTTQDLKKRLKNHRSKSQESHRKTTPLYDHFNKIGWNLAVITLVAELDVADRGELLLQEDQLIRQHMTDEKCLNKCHVTITPEERKQKDKLCGIKRRSEKKEEDRERIKTWRALNPEKWREQTARYRKKKAAVNI
jgi:Uri superfamily endonuclease